MRLSALTLKPREASRMLGSAAHLPAVAALELIGIDCGSAGVGPVRDAEMLEGLTCLLLPGSCSLLGCAVIVQWEPWRHHPSTRR